jgi:predicted transcriptional regulator
MRSVTKIMREAIEALQELPQERQETIARAILDYASDDDGVYHLTDDERVEVQAGLGEIERGEIPSDDEVQAVYDHIGL